MSCVVLSKQKTAYEMRISDWSSDVCSSDLRHSRVARSDLQALRTLGAGEVRACGPRTLLPEDATLGGCTVMRDFDAALEGVDAVMMLRLQRENGRASCKERVGPVE